MESLASFFTASGRIAPRSFAVAVTGVYVTSFLSQFLLAAPLVARAGVFPFLAVQVATIWSWYALHAMRLRDADRGAGMALAISILYGLGIVLLVLIVLLLGLSPPAPVASGTAADSPAAGFVELFLLLYLIALLTGDPSLGIFGYVMLAVLALIIVPMLISVAFSLWAALRPSKPAGTTTPA
jgi:uncharacterized membrane protein YhaH (DUF805 family)